MIRSSKASKICLAVHGERLVTGGALDHPAEQVGAAVAERFSSPCQHSGASPAKGYQKLPYRLRMTVMIAEMEASDPRRLGAKARRPGFVMLLILVFAVGLPTHSQAHTARTAADLPLPLGLGSLPLPLGRSAPAPTVSAPVATPRPSRPPRSSCSGSSKSGPVTYIQAVFPCDFPDPMVLKVGKVWFAYSTTTGWERDRRVFPILRSEDLRQWHHVGDALHRPPAWSAGDLWSPSVLPWHGRYLLFYSAMAARSHRHCVAVASARQPQGPFRTVRRLACRDGATSGYIDPAPLVAARGRLYLFFSVDSPRHSIAALRLSAGGLRPAGYVHPVLGVSPRWGQLNSRTVEGPSPLYRHGRYYLFYSAGSWNSDYRMAYAVARAPLGPYRDSAPVPIVGGSRPLPSPGGGAVANGRGSAMWLAFAAWSGRPGYQNRSKRTLRIAPLRWRRRGIPSLVLRGGG